MSNTGDRTDLDNPDAHAQGDVHNTGDTHIPGRDDGYDTDDSTSSHGSQRSRQSHRLPHTSSILQYQSTLPLSTSINNTSTNISYKDIELAKEYKLVVTKYGSNFNKFNYMFNLLVAQYDDLTLYIFTDMSKNAQFKRSIDARAKLVICTNIDSSIAEDLQGCLTAHEMYTELVSRYGTSSLSMRVSLLKQLINRQQNDNTPIRDHVRSIEHIWNEYKQAGGKLDEELRVILLLLSLNRKYETIRTFIISAGKVKVKDVLPLLFDFNIQQTTLQGAPRGTPSGNEALTAGSSSNNNNNKPKLKCEYCSRSGHTVADCFHKKWYDKQQKTGNNSQKPGNSGSATDKQAKQSKPANLAMVTTLSLVSSLISEDHMVWVLDSGATSHVTPNRDAFVSYHDYSDKVTGVGGDDLSVVGIGTVQLQADVHTLTMSNVKHVPGAKYNLLSVPTLQRKGWTITFDEHGDCILSVGEYFVTAEYCEGLYIIRGKVSSFDQVEDNSQEHALVSTKVSAQTWHERMGHVGQGTLQVTIPHVRGIDIAPSDLSLDTCTACQIGKHTRAHFQSSDSTTDRPLKLVHSDLLGPVNVKSLAGKSYVVTFLDDYTKYIYVGFLTTKDEALYWFKKYMAYAERLHNCKIVALQSDGGGEYLGEFAQLCSELGITHRITSAYTPQQNGSAERLNRTLVELARSMLYAVGNDNSFLWAEAVNTAVYIRNRVVGRSTNGMTPYQAWFGHMPSVKHLKIFGCICFAHIHNTVKFGDKAEQGVLVGYSLVRKAYRIYIPHRRMVIENIHVTFDESRLYRDGQDVSDEIDKLYDFDDQPVEDQEHTTTNSSIEVVNANEESVVADDNADEAVRDDISDESFPVVQGKVEADIPHTGRYAKRARWTPLEADELADLIKRKSSDDDVVELAVEYKDKFNSAHHINEIINKIQSAHKIYTRQIVGTVLIATTEDIRIPRTFSEAMQSPQRKHWKQAMDDEIASLHKNGTWKLIKRRLASNVVKCRWVYSVKTDAFGNIIRYKARLVAKGFTQRYGIDFSETYAPVVRTTSIRIVLTIAASLDFEIQQLDIKTAFLNGELDEEIFMEQPPGYESGDPGELVCKLQKSLYGLKQSPRVWNLTISKFLIQIGFKQVIVELGIFVIWSSDIKCIIALYVDDMIVAANKMSFIDDVKRQLCSKFEITDLGDIKYILGILVERDRKNRTVYLSQVNYLSSVLDKFGMTECKPASTPLDASVQLVAATESDTVNDQSIPYLSAVGSIMYAMICTRPDLAFAISEVSKFSSKFTSQHWTAVKHILRYIKGSLNYKLKLGGFDEVSKITVYADANWGRDEGRRSNTGYAAYIGNSLVSWKSRKQQTVARSTCEAEYMSISDAAAEAKWLGMVLESIGIEIQRPITLFNDNQGAIALTNHPGHHEATKHIDIRYHFIRFLVDEGLIRVHYCSTDNMVADVLTKPLGKVKHEQFTSKLLFTQQHSSGSVEN